VSQPSFAIIIAATLMSPAESIGDFVILASESLNLFRPEAGLFVECEVSLDISLLYPPVMYALLYHYRYLIFNGFAPFLFFVVFSLFSKPVFAREKRGSEKKL